MYSIYFLFSCVGTNGGVSAPGLWFGFIGGLIIGLTYFFTLIYTCDSTLLERAPAQWPIIIVGGIAGLIGSIIDSYIGAIFQYSGKCLYIYTQDMKKIVHRTVTSMFWFF